LGDLSPDLVDQIEHFLVSYNQANGEEFLPKRRVGRDAAEKLLDAGMMRPRKGDEICKAKIRRDKAGGSQRVVPSRPERSMKYRYDGVLLDIDGTIVDSNAAHASAWVDAFSAHGRRVSFDRIRPLIGVGGDKLLQSVASLDHDSGEGKTIAESRAQIFKRHYLPTLQPTPEAERFVQWLIGSGLRVVVATSAQEDELEDLLAVCGARAFLDRATTSDDAEHSKPDPDIIVAALKKSKCEVDRVVMIGDTPYDIEAARRAGNRTIAFR
jgi:HAD superfamily hydrolase (TIGR01509 family)